MSFGTIWIFFIQMIIFCIFEYQKLAALPGDKRDTSDGSPFGIYQFGRTAKTGGSYSTTRIPFLISIKTTIEASPSCQNDSVYWFMIRGLEVRIRKYLHFVLHYIIYVVTK